MNTGGARTCALASSSDSVNGLMDTALACTPGGVDSMFLFGLGGGVQTDTCVSPGDRCIAWAIPAPV